MERELTPRYEIRTLRVDDYEPVRRMHGRVWRATYPNEEAGVPREWVDEETAQWLLPESLERSKAMFETMVAQPETHFYRVVEQNGATMGFVYATHEDGHYNLSALYVDPGLQGSGVADELMQLVDEWVGDNDIDLEVVTYNARAIRFYEKHGFVMSDTDNELFKGKLPNRTMVRKAKEQ